MKRPSLIKTTVLEITYQPLFETIEKWYSLDTSTKEKIIHLTSVRKVKKGDYLFQEGFVGSKLYYVVQGALRVFKLDNDFKEHIIRFGFENSMVGDIRSFLYQSKTELNLQALENSILIEVESDDLKELFTFSNNLSLFYKDFLEYELSRSQDRIINQLSSSAEERYMKFLKDYGDFNNRIPDRHIASFIGVTPEFFSKLKKKKIREFLDLR